MKKYRKQILICAGLVTLTNVAAQQQQKPYGGGGEPV